MAEELVGLDQAILKIKSMSSVFQAFSDMKEVLEFLANNKGIIASHTSEIQKMTKDKRVRQEELEGLYKKISEAQLKLDNISADYKKKTLEAKQTYEEAADKARKEYLNQRDSAIRDFEATQTALLKEKKLLQTEISDLGQVLQGLRAEYEALRRRFK